MPELSGIYDAGPIQPIALIRENLSIWTSGRWSHYKVKNIEPMPRSSPMMVEMVALSGAMTIGANGTINAQILAILQLGENELLHLRWEPIDDMEGVLWEQASTGRFVTRGVQARVNLFTSTRDPYLCTTTFFILGKDRDINLEVRNPNPVAMPMARFVFWGFRYHLEDIKDTNIIKEIEEGRRASRWLPAEGF